MTVALVLSAVYFQYLRKEILNCIRAITTLQHVSLMVLLILHIIKKQVVTAVLLTITTSTIFHPLGFSNVVATTTLPHDNP